jgi:starch phosphorylase
MKLLTDTERPIQLIFAGKAHPHDVPGKNLIKDIVKFASNPEVRSRIVFLENYDIEVARQLVSGSDLWLNTPRRPMEASGTSGMKAALNGVLNCSVLDGWWAEAYSPDIGWAIGRGEVYEDSELQDQIESEALYDLLEREIIPSYYDRGMDGLPREWITKMKASMSHIGKEFSCHRMIMEYHTLFYEPALKNYSRMKKNSYSPAKKLSEYVWRVRGVWDSVKVLHVTGPERPNFKVGDTLTVEAVVDLAGLDPADVKVEVYAGHYGSKGDIENARALEMTPQGTAQVPHDGDGPDAPDQEGHGEGASGAEGVRFTAELTATQAGRQALSVRIRPRNEDLAHEYVPGLVRWA